MSWHSTNTAGPHSGIARALACISSALFSPSEITIDKRPARRPNFVLTSCHGTKTTVRRKYLVVSSILAISSHYSRLLATVTAANSSTDVALTLDLNFVGFLTNTGEEAYTKYMSNPWLSRKTGIPITPSEAGLIVLWALVFTDQSSPSVATRDTRRATGESNRLQNNQNKRGPANIYRCISRACPTFI